MQLVVHFFFESNGAGLGLVSAGGALLTRPLVGSPGGNASGLVMSQVYVQLLRCIQTEVKDLVHAALDILVPALPFRLTTTVSRF